MVYPPVTLPIRLAGSGGSESAGKDQRRVTSRRDGLSFWIWIAARPRMPNARLIRTRPMGFGRSFEEVPDEVDGGVGFETKVSPSNDWKGVSVGATLGLPGSVLSLGELLGSPGVLCGPDELSSVGVGVGVAVGVGVTVLVGVGVGVFVGVGVGVFVGVGVGVFVGVDVAVFVGVPVAPWND